MSEPAFRREVDASEAVDAAAAVMASSPQTFTPSAGRLVVRMDPLPKTTDTGLIVRPDRIADYTAYGEVIALGPANLDEWGQRVPWELALGERVVFDWRPSHEELAMRKYFGERTILLKEDEIVGVIEPN